MPQNPSFADSARCEPCDVPLPEGAKWLKLCEAELTTSGGGVFAKKWAAALAITGAVFAGGLLTAGILMFAGRKDKYDESYAALE